MGNVNSVEETLTASGYDGEDPEVVLVGKIVLHQRAVELAGSEPQDVLPGCSFSLATSPATSPWMRVAFHLVSCKEVETTYLGRPLILSA